MWTIFKVFIEFVTILLLIFMFWRFGHNARRILAPWPGIKPVLPASEGGVLTTGLSGKSSNILQERLNTASSFRETNLLCRGWFMFWKMFIQAFLECVCRTATQSLQNNSIILQQESEFS